MFSPVSFTSLFPPTIARVIIMSSIMERMCADIFQQTGATLRPPMDGQETIPYRNLLPAKDPIHMSLSKQFQAVLSKGWVDSQALHLFDSLLNMGGVFWFTNNLIKVGCRREESHGLCTKTFLSSHCVNVKKRLKKPTIPDFRYFVLILQYPANVSLLQHVATLKCLRVPHRTIESICGQNHQTQ